MSRNSESIELSVVLVRETQRAFLVDHGGREHVWLPKSLATMEKEGAATWTLTLPEWLAEREGMI